MPACPEEKSRLTVMSAGFFVPIKTVKEAERKKVLGIRKDCDHSQGEIPHRFVKFDIVTTCMIQ